MIEYKYSKDDLVGILKHHVTTGERWEFYKETVAVAEYWHKIISGKKHDDILLSLRQGEQKELKQQRVRLYNSRTKSVANKIINQIKEVYRSDNIFNELYFTEKKDDNVDKVKKITESLKNFSGNKTVRNWLRDRFLRLNVIDPNSFFVVNFTGTKGPETYYPIEVRSKDVLGRQYLNGVLQYLAFVERVYEKINKDGKVKTVVSFKYWIFGPNDAILLHKVPNGATPIGIPIDISQGEDAISLTEEPTSYSWYYSDYKINAMQVPAVCVGYIPDPETDDKTFESILSPAKELFNELIWRKSAYDIHLTLHGIAQKFAFVPTCDFEDKSLGLKCNDGRLTNGGTCVQCNGTGQMPFHTSEQDIITLSLPRDQKEIWDLSKMIYYQVIPENIIQLTKDALMEAEKAIPLAIFNRSIVDKGDLVKAETATKVRDDYNSTNNVLYDFGLADADVYRFLVKQIAIYGNNFRDDLVVEYGYPTDFNLETLSDLFVQSKEASGAGSPPIVKSKINGKIISKLLIDDKTAIQNYETREYWRPFTDGAQLSMVPELDRSRILYIYYDQIFRELEATTMTNDQGEEIPFALLPRDKQKNFIDEKVSVYLDQYKKAKEAAPKITVPRTS